MELEAPREVIRSCGLSIAEMQRRRERAVCCGGGNAGFARETEEAFRVDQLRTSQVQDTGARLLVTACPECKMMLDAAVDETKDIAEVLAGALAAG
jgi:Fe-S oxidoreductase